jgi:gluconate:H+ symporter, GntP family
MITENVLVALAGLTAVVALLFLLITRFKWHVFLALLVPDPPLRGGSGARPGGLHRRLRAGLRAHDPEHRGGDRARVDPRGGAEAHRRSRADHPTMIRWVGERRMPLALTLSGFVIGIAIFSDVGYVILNPLVHSAALKTGLNMSVMATGLVGAMQLTHAMVPPTPGPLAAVALVEADIGKVILFGGSPRWSGRWRGGCSPWWWGPAIESPPSEEFVGQSFIERGLEPSCPRRGAYAPILIPLAPHRRAERRSLRPPGRPHRERRDALSRLAGRGAQHRSPAGLPETQGEQASARTGEWVETRCAPPQ